MSISSSSSLQVLRVSGEQRGELVEIRDRGGVAGLQSQGLAVRRRCQLVLAVEVEDGAEVRVAAGLLGPQAQRVPVPDLRLVQPIGAAQTRGCSHGELVVRAREGGGQEVRLGRLGQAALHAQEQTCGGERERWLEELIIVLVSEGVKEIKGSW